MDSEFGSCEYNHGNIEKVRIDYIYIMQLQCVQVYGNIYKARVFILPKVDKNMLVFDFYAISKELCLNFHVSMDMLNFKQTNHACYKNKKGKMHNKVEVSKSVLEYSWIQMK